MHANRAKDIATHGDRTILDGQVLSLKAEFIKWVLEKANGGHTEGCWVISPKNCHPKAVEEFQSYAQNSCGYHLKLHPADGFMLYPYFDVRWG